MISITQMARRLPIAAWSACGLFFLSLMLVAGPGTAAGLGPLTVRSTLGQPLNADIDLVAVSARDTDTLVARIAPAARYQQAGRPYNASAIGLTATVRTRSNGTPYVHLVSSRPVSEPAMHVLIELTSAGVPLVREYSVLLQPPDTGPAAKR